MSDIRHPEKINRVSNPIPKKPSWIRVKAPTSKFFKSTNKIIKDKVAIYDLSADQRENKVRGDKLENYPLHKLPKYLQDNSNKYREWID